MFYVVKGDCGKLDEIIGTCQDSTLEDFRRVLIKHLKYNEKYVNGFKRVKPDNVEDSIFIKSAFEIIDRFINPNTNEEEFYLVLPRTLPIAKDNEGIFETEEFKNEVLKTLAVHTYDIVVDAVYEHLGLALNNKYKILKPLKEEETDASDMVETELFGEHVKEIRNCNCGFDKNTLVFNDLLKREDVKKNFDNLLNVTQACNIMKCLNLELFSIKCFDTVSKSLQKNACIYKDCKRMFIREINNTEVYAENQKVYDLTDKDRKALEIVITPALSSAVKITDVAIILEYVTGSVSPEYIAHTYLKDYTKRYNHDILFEGVENILAEVSNKMYDIILDDYYLD